MREKTGPESRQDGWQSADQKFHLGLMARNLAYIHDDMAALAAAGMADEGVRDRLLDLLMDAALTRELFLYQLQEMDKAPPE